MLSFGTKPATFDSIMSTFYTARDQLAKLISSENDKVSSSYEVIDAEEAKIESALSVIEQASRAESKISEFLA